MSLFDICGPIKIVMSSDTQQQDGTCIYHVLSLFSLCYCAPIERSGIITQTLHFPLCHGHYRGTGEGKQKWALGLEEIALYFDIQPQDIYKRIDSVE